MTRRYNFCAGPAALPEPVLQRAQSELLDWHGAGLSVMEMSHRSEAFTGIAEGAEAALRRLLDIPDDYAVLFLQGGASLQFAAVPLNLAAPEQVADYIDTGQWSQKAIAEAQRFTQVNVAASTRAEAYRRAPKSQEWKTSAAAYLHYTPNETIGGLEFQWLPEVSVPLVADMSSTILSRPLDVRRFGVIYAGAQKNIGPAGLTLVIVRRDLLGRAQSSCPTMLNWTVAADNGSMYNTPPTFALYLAGLVFAWLESEGGLVEMARRNSAKAAKLYAAIDDNPFYANPIAIEDRSWMNVPFTLADPELEPVFLREAEQAGLLNLQGHRSIGGMRASLYNAVTEQAVDALIAFLEDFARRHGKGSTA